MLDYDDDETIETLNLVLIDETIQADLDWIGVFLPIPDQFCFVKVPDKVLRLERDAGWRTGPGVERYVGSIYSDPTFACENTPANAAKQIAQAVVCTYWDNAYYDCFERFDGKYGWPDPYDTNVTDILVREEVVCEDFMLIVHAMRQRQAAYGWPLLNLFVKRSDGAFVCR
jgi:hypothetical protein